MAKLEDAKIVVEIDTEAARKKADDFTRDRERRQDEEKREERSEKKKEERKNRRRGGLDAASQTILSGPQGLAQRALHAVGAGVVIGAQLEAAQLLSAMLAGTIRSEVKDPDIVKIMKGEASFSDAVRNAIADQLDRTQRAIAELQAAVKAAFGAIMSTTAQAKAQILLRGTADAEFLKEGAAAEFQIHLAMERLHESQHKVARELAGVAVSGLVEGSLKSGAGGG